MTANLEKRLRKSLGNEALEQRITELECRVRSLEYFAPFAPTKDPIVQRMLSVEQPAPIEEPKKRGRPKKPKPE